MKYVYPVILTLEDEGGYSVHFPDVEGVFTQGEDLADALSMAEDALALMLYDLEVSKEKINPPSDIKTIKVNENQILSLVTADTMVYRKMYESKAVKKTLTIPSWLNEEAERNEINFSATLQEALKSKLKIG